MKKFLLLIISLILLFVSCGPVPQDNKPSSRPEQTYVGDIFHLNGCKGHNLYVSKMDFEQDGHQMWVFTFSSHYSDDLEPVIIHSPDCKKCNPETKSILDNLSSSSTSSWGW